MNSIDKYVCISVVQYVSLMVGLQKNPPPLTAYDVEGSCVVVHAFTIPINKIIWSCKCLKKGYFSVKPEPEPAQCTTSITSTTTHN